MPTDRSATHLPIAGIRAPAGDATWLSELPGTLTPKQDDSA